MTQPAVRVTPWLPGIPSTYTPPPALPRPIPPRQHLTAALGGTGALSALAWPTTLHAVLSGTGTLGAAALGPARRPAALGGRGSLTVQANPMLQEKVSVRLIGAGTLSATATH